jgi:hypothetical protein
MKLTEFLEKSNDQNFLANLTKVNLILDISDVVDQNCLLKLADALWNCVNLQEFILQYGFIGINSNNTYYNIIFAALENCQELKIFDIAFNHVGNLDDSDIEALSFFIASSNLENINFKDNELNKLSHGNLRILFDAIAKCQNLKYLYISDNDFHMVDDIKFDIICASLKNCEKLLDFYMLVPYISSERQKKIFEIKNYITQRRDANYQHMPLFHKDPMQSLGDENYQHMLILNKDSMQTMIIFSQAETTPPLDKNKKLPEENVQVTVEENTNSIISKCILM